MKRLQGWTGPATAGSVALLLGAALLWVSLRGEPHTEPPAHDAAATQPVAQVATSTVVNRTGRYSVSVPKAMRVTRHGAVTRIRDRSRSTTMTISPLRRARLGPATTDVLAAMGSTYRTVDLLATQHWKVAGRTALASFGKATTRRGVRLRFVLVAVAGIRRTYAISTFTAAGSDPAKVLPRVRAVTRGFRPLR